MAASTSRFDLTAVVRRELAPRKRWQNIYGYLFLTPWLIGFLVIFYWPRADIPLPQPDKIRRTQPAPVHRLRKLRQDVHRRSPILAFSTRTAYYAGVGVPLGVWVSDVSGDPAQQ